jgi:hypothetical protein
MHVKKTGDGQAQSKHQYIRKNKNLITPSNSRNFREKEYAGYF